MNVHRHTKLSLSTVWERTPVVELQVDQIMSKRGRMWTALAETPAELYRTTCHPCPHWFSPTGRWTLLWSFRLQLVPCGWEVAVWPAFMATFCPLTLGMPERPTHALSTESENSCDAPQPSTKSSLHSHPILVPRSVPIDTSVAHFQDDREGTSC